MATHFVIVEKINYGRSYRAKPGLSFKSEADAQAWINGNVNKTWHDRYHVESRKVKDLDASQVMHCQCCNRAIHAALGTIAHHGYQRPGSGWQTRSCFGAKRLPFEVDRTAVAELIDHLKEILLRSEYERAAVFDEIEPVTHNYQVYDRKVRGGYRGGTITMTRDTFDAIVKANVDNVFTHSRTTFDQFKARDLAHRDFRIEGIRRDLKQLAARYAGWKQTHKWNDKLWESI